MLAHHACQTVSHFRYFVYKDLQFGTQGVFV
jgi:hypothetical protein